MKVLRITLNVLGIIFIVINIMSDITYKEYTTNGGTGYFIGYQMGKQILLILGIVFIIIAARINKKLKAKSN
jgi:uncharacterized membrane protein